MSKRRRKNIRKNNRNQAAGQTVVQNRKIATGAFNQWSTHYLKTLFTEVIYPAADNKDINTILWRELQNAASYCPTCKSTLFNSFEQWELVPIQLVYIGNPTLSDFIAPLRYIYENGIIRTKKNKIHTKRKEVIVGAMKSDLENIKVESINVIACPLPIPSKLTNENFEADVIKILTYVLSTNGYKYLSSQQLSECFKVTREDFESWANKSSKLISRTLKHRDDMVYYGLAPLKIKPSVNDIDKEETMTLNSNANAAEGVPLEKPFPLVESSTENAEIVPAEVVEPLVIGSDEFNTFIIQFLSESGKVWRSISAISKGSEIEDEVALMAWLDENPALLRRYGSKDSVIWYALSSKLAPIETEVKKADGKGKDDSKSKAKDGKKTEENKVKPKQHLSITTDGAAFAMLHHVYDGFVRMMNFYANHLATKHSESFSHFTKAQQELGAGLALLQKEVKVKDSQLPPLSDL